MELMTGQLVKALMSDDDAGSSSMAAGSTFYSLIQMCMVGIDLPMHSVGVYAKMTPSDDPENDGSPIIDICPSLGSHALSILDSKAEETALSGCEKFIEEFTELVDDVKSTAPSEEHACRLTNIWDRAKVFAAALFWSIDHGFQVDLRMREESLPEDDPWMIDPLFGGCASKRVNKIFRNMDVMHKAFAIGSVTLSSTSNADLIKKIEDIMGQHDSDEDYSS